MIPTIRCSSLDRVLSCPGSRTLIAKIEESALDIGGDSGTNVTWIGNWCHWEAARRLIQDHGAIGPAGGLPPPEVPATWKPTIWEYRKVDWFLSMLLELTPKDHTFFVEQHLVWDTEKFQLTGHLDVYSMSADGTEVHWNDQKTGPAEVDEAANNWQLGGYGALLKSLYPSLKKGTARILQRDNHDRPVSEVEIDDMDRIQPFMAEKINAALTNIYQTETGKQCNYCPALFICPTIREAIDDMKKLLTPDEVARLKVVPEIKELAEVARRCRLLSTPMDKMIDALKERMKVGGPDIQISGGYVARLVEENGRRKTEHPKAIWDFCSAKLTEDQLWSCYDPSLAAIEDELVKTGMKRSSKKEESAEGFIKSMSHLYEQPKVTKLRFVAQ